MGLLCLLLALTLRFGPRLGKLLAKPETGEFLLYVQTGYLAQPQSPVGLAYAGESAVPKGARVPQPEPVPTQAPEPVFTAEDGVRAAIDNDAGVTVDPGALILEEPSFPETAGPKVLIYSTHTTESYTKAGENYIETAAYRTLDSGFNMLSLGQALEEALERRGIGVVRDESLHDYPDYNSAYVSSRKSVAAYLEQYPSLALVLDLHRDASAGKQQLRPLTQTAAGQTARVMLVVGTDASGRSHPNWQKNCALALRLQTLLDRQSPGFPRPINLRAQRFNQDLSPGALLIEIGGAGNTHGEALAAVEQLAEGIAALGLGSH